MITATLCCFIYDKASKPSHLIYPNKLLLSDLFALFISAPSNILWSTTGLAALMDSGLSWWCKNNNANGLSNLQNLPPCVCVHVLPRLCVFTEPRPSVKESALTFSLRLKTIQSTEDQILSLLWITDCKEGREGKTKEKKETDRWGDRESSCCFQRQC